MNKVIDINKAQKNKTEAEKILEKKLTTGQKLSSQEALTILMEMSGVVADMSQAIQQLSYQTQALEMHITTSSAREVTLFKLLQDKKGLFTEDEFKDAYQEYVVKPMEEKQKLVADAKKKAEDDELNKVKEEAKEASLDAAQGKEGTSDTPDPVEVQESTDEKPSGEVSEEPTSPAA